MVLKLRYDADACVPVCVCVGCLHEYESSTVVCHGFQHLCVYLAHLWKAVVDLAHRQLLGIIYFIVLFKPLLLS